MNEQDHITVPENAELFLRYPELYGQKVNIEKALNLMLHTYKSGGKILLCGNGGSAADCEHIAGELMKGFLSKRELTQEQKDAFNKYYPEDDFIKYIQRAIPAIPLCSINSVFTAYCNDVNPDYVYSQLVYGYGKPGDLLFCISTSGNSKNTVLAAKTAKVMGIPIVALTGRKESRLEDISNVTIKVPDDETYKVQEYHLPVYHYLCMRLEETVFGG